MAQTVSRRSLNAEPGFEPRSLHVGYVEEKVTLGHVFSQNASNFPYQCNSTIAPSSSEYCPYQEDKRTKPRNFQTKQFSVGNRTAGHWMEEYYNIRTSVLHRVEDLKNNRLRSKQPCL
jgi:hypothetical protein